VLDFDDFDIRGHSPYAATDDSEPEPDVSVSRRSKYAGHPDRALLLIEVSGSSLRKDRTIKTEIYAEAAVPEYWIVDIKKHRIDVLTHPTAHGYSRTKQLVVGDTLRPMRMPGIAIELASIPWVLPERPKRRKRR
jgi:Uma2 family endonuclease